jgi:hypothetical protein
MQVKKISGGQKGVAPRRAQLSLATRSSLFELVDQLFRRALHGRHRSITRKTQSPQCYLDGNKKCFDVR